MKRKGVVSLVVACCLLMSFQAVLAAPGTINAKSPVAFSAPVPEELVQSMTKFMNSLPRFYISGTANYDKIYQDNDKIQYSFDFDYYVKRPGEFQINLDGDLQKKQILFNGKNLTIYDEDKALYAVIDTPPTIDAALDMAANDYGMNLAILDVARSNFAGNLLQDVVKSVYVGKSNVGDIPCHHVAFAKKDRNIQVWIEDGEKPFLRKVVITYKGHPAMPTWIFEVTDWNLSPELPEGWSTFAVKPGMARTTFLKPSEKAIAETK